MSTARRAFVAGTVVAAIVSGCAQPGQDETNARSRRAESGPSCEQWLRTLLVEIGAPEGHDVEPTDLTDFGGGSSSIRVDIPAYEARFDVSTFAEEPDLVNVEVETIPVLARFDDFVLRANRVVGDTQQFVLEGSDFWITMHIVPGTDEMSPDAVQEWFGHVVDSIAETPPPGCEP